MKYINAKMYIQRTDDTLFDVSGELKNVSINKGDTYLVGDLGCDGVAATMEFSLANIEGKSYSPKKKYGKVKYFRDTLTGNGTKTYTLSKSNVLPNTATMWDINAGVYEWYNYNELPADWTYNTMPDVAWLKLYKTEPESNIECLITVTSSNTITTGKVIPVGVEFEVQYCYMDKKEKNPLNWIGMEYSPLLFENRRVTFYSMEEVPIHKKTALTGNGDIRIDCPVSVDILKICRGTVTVYSDNTGTMDGCLVDIDYNAEQFVFPFSTTMGSTIEIQYSYITQEPKMRFDGYIDKISGGRNEMRITCRDKAKRLQAKMILPGTQRTYTVTESNGKYIVLDNKTSTTYTDGIPIQTYLQNVLNDEFVTATPTIVVPVNPNYVLRQNLDTIWEYKTTWDVLQSVVNVIGYSIGYVYDSTANAFQLKLFAPPRTKKTADYNVTSNRNLKVQELDLDGDSVRNVVMVKYYDIDTQASATVTASEIYDVEDVRAMLVEEDKAQGIDTAAEATTLANAILSDTKDHLLGWRVTMNINPNIDIFSTISVDNYTMSSDIDFVGCQSVQHTWDFVAKKFETVVAGYQKIIGAKAKWNRLETRPGKFIPATSKRITSLVKPPKLSNFTTSFDVDFSGATPQGYLSVDWAKPVGVDIAKYSFRYMATGDYQYNYVDVTTDQIKIPIAFAKSYIFNVRAVTTSQVAGDWSDNVTVMCPNALYPYMKNDELHIKSQAVLNTFAGRLANYTGGDPSSCAYSTDVINALVFYEGTYSIDSLSFKIWSRNDIRIYTTGNVTLTQSNTFTFYLVAHSISITGITGDVTKQPLALYNRSSTRNFSVMLNKLVGLGGSVYVYNTYNLTKTFVLKMTECAFETTSKREIWTIDSPSSTVTENIAIKNNVFSYCDISFSYTRGSNISNLSINDNTFANARIVNYNSTIFTKLHLVNNKISNTVAYSIVNAFIGTGTVTLNKCIITGNTMESFSGSTSKLIYANMQNTAVYSNVNENSTLYYTGATIVNCQIVNNIAY